MAKLSNERKTGARGLRAIIETSLMDYMFELPSAEDVTECVITKDVIRGTGKPLLRTESGEPLKLTDKEEKEESA